MNEKGKILTTLFAVCLAISFVGVSQVRADIPIDEMEPNDDCTMIQALGDLVSGDPHVISGSSDPVTDLADFSGFTAGPGFITMTLDCTDDIDLWIGYCEEGIFYYVAASATYDCPEIIDGWFSETAEWVVLVEASYALALSDYTLTIEWTSCPDADLDGFLDETCGGDDCDDTNPDVYPGAIEDCVDGVDNDCNGLVDDADPACACDTPDYDIACGDTVTGTTVGGENVLGLYPDCVGWDESGPEVIYTLTTDTAGRIVAEISDLAVDLDVFILADAAGEACTGSCLAYGSLTATLEDAPAGTYYIVVDGYNGVEGDYTLTVECCVDADLDGFYDLACGGDDCDDADALINPDAEEICDDTVDNDCDGLIDGDDFDCIELTNDDCSGAIDLGALPASVVADTTAATDDIVEPCVVSSGPYKNVWYTVMGTGQTMTATTCSETSAFDTKISVFGGACEALVCIDGDDDDPSCSFSSLRSTVSWASEEDVPYLITVGGYSASSYGMFELIVTSCQDLDLDGYLDVACGGDDCDDTDAAVNPGADEICDDGIDNDCNGLVDGDDAGCTCDTPDYTIACGDEVTGTTLGGTDVLSGYPGCTTYPETGPESIYTLTLDEASPVQITLSGLAADLDLYLLADAAGEACVYSCIAYSAGTGDEVISTETLAAGTYHIVVDGYNGAASDFALSVVCCDDLDGDGYSDAACGGDDCDDMDPTVNPGAVELCDDLVDNDCDGLVDYDDPDCVAEYTLTVDASYDAGTLGLDFELGTPGEVLWGTWLLVTQPSVGLRKLWVAPLPLLDPPIEWGVTTPFPAYGVVGFITAFVTPDGVQATDRAFVDTGTP